MSEYLKVTFRNREAPAFFITDSNEPIVRIMSAVVMLEIGPVQVFDFVDLETPPANAVPLTLE